MKAQWFVFALLLTACPYDPEAAGLTQVDGGYVYGQGDAAVFWPVVPDGGVYGPDILPMAPTREQLCTLYIGDYNEDTDYPSRLGTWVKDVTRIFGEPPRNGLLLEEDGAKMTYNWRGDGGADDIAGITLSFEYVLLNLSRKDFNYVKDSYWLNGVQLRGGDFMDCWRWQLGEPGRVQCADCVDTSKFGQCPKFTDTPRDCFVPKD